MIAEVSKIGKRGVMVIPAELRHRFGLEEGTFVVLEENEEGVLLKPATVLPLETYTPQRKAEFILSNATDKADYAKAIEEVRAMGLDPQKIKHVSMVEA